MNPKSNRPQPNQFMASYKVPRHPAPISLRLDGNEGAAPEASVLDNLSVGIANQLNQYPSTKGLEHLIAQLFDCKAAEVCVTAGGDDALLRMCRAFLSETRHLLLPTPSFEMLPRFASWCNSTVQTVDWTSPRYPTEAVLKAVDETTGIIGVVSPNNPTGGFATPEDLIRLSEAALTLCSWWTAPTPSLQSVT